MSLYIEDQKYFTLTLQNSEFIQSPFLSHVLGLPIQTVTDVLKNAAQKHNLTLFETPKKVLAIMVGAFPVVIKEIIEMRTTPLQEQSWLQGVEPESQRFTIQTPSHHKVIYHYS